MTASQTLFEVADYDLDATLDSGQAFRWRGDGAGWTGIVAGRRVRLRSVPEGIRAETDQSVTDWQWLKTYLQTDVSLDDVLASFPRDPVLNQAVDRLRGLRLLRQDPWECLASFILSSTKQIVQIRQLCDALAAVYGTPIDAAVPPPSVDAEVARRKGLTARGARLLTSSPTSYMGGGQVRAEHAASPEPHLGAGSAQSDRTSCHSPADKAVRAPAQESKPQPLSSADSLPRPDAEAHAFPTPERLAAAPESELRALKLGFRAPYLLAAARQVAQGRLDLPGLARLPLDQARQRLMQLPGVGRKIADCVLLFSCGHERAFPVDVWIKRVLEQQYFGGRSQTFKNLHAFVSGHFGPHAGYAQQYLFHYSRLKAGRTGQPQPDSRRPNDTPDSSPLHPRRVQAVA